MAACASTLSSPAAPRDFGLGQPLRTVLANAPAPLRRALEKEKQMKRDLRFEELYPYPPDRVWRRSPTRKPSPTG